MRAVSFFRCLARARKSHSTCRPCQNSADCPKSAPKRPDIAGVIDRFGLKVVAVVNALANKKNSAADAAEFEGLLTVAENVGTVANSCGEIFHGGFECPLHKVDCMKTISLVVVTLTGVRDIAPVSGE